MTFATVIREDSWEKHGRMQEIAQAQSEEAMDDGEIAQLHPTLHCNNWWQNWRRIPIWTAGLLKWFSNEKEHNLNNSKQHMQYVLQEYDGETNDKKATTQT